MLDIPNVFFADPLGLALLLLVSFVILIYLIAFFQGREVSFWPPRIAGKPIQMGADGGSSTGVMAAIRTRKSVRGYMDRPVEDEKLNAILEAGRLAPSSSNRQEWRFVIVRDTGTRKKLSGSASTIAAFIGKAPVVIAACAETDGHVMRCGQPSYPIDVAIALDHITLAAVEQGLGTCWIGMFDEGKVKDILGIPGKIRVVALMTLGYPDDPSAIEKKRLAMEKIVKYEHW